MRLLSLLLLCTVLAASANGQQDRRIDSVLHEIQMAKDDTNKVEMYRFLFYDCQSECNALFYGGDDLKRKMSYADEILAISQRLNYQYGMAVGYSCKGLVYVNEKPGHFKKAVDNFVLARDIFALKGNRCSSAGVLCNIGMVYMRQFKSDAAMSVLNAARQIQEELHDSLGLAVTLFNMGQVCLALRSYDQATDNFLKAKAVFESTGKQKALSLSYVNLGWTFAREKKYADALAAANTALAIAAKSGWCGGMDEAKVCLEYIGKHNKSKE